MPRSVEGAFTWELVTWDWPEMHGLIGMLEWIQDAHVCLKYGEEVQPRSSISGHFEPDGQAPANFDLGDVALFAIFSILLLLELRNGSACAPD